MSDLKDRRYKSRNAPKVPFSSENATNLTDFPLQRICRFEKLNAQPHQKSVEMAQIWLLWLQLDSAARIWIPDF